jgi:molybdenum cofactor cytidylyltransferase
MDVTGGGGAGIAGIVLAAGASTRMGRPKMLLPLAGGTLLSVVVRALLDGGLSQVVVVLGPEADVVRRDAVLPDDGRLRVVVNLEWREGMASSLRRGLSECGLAEAALVTLGDQPGITAERVRRILAAWRPGASLVVPVHEGRSGHPVLIGRPLWAELQGLRGDVGAREVVKRHLEEAILVSAEPLADVDTEEDLRRYLAGEPGPDSGFELPGSGRPTGRH